MESKLKYTLPQPTIEGWISPEELNWIHDRATLMDNVVEIGCWKGRSTHALLTGCKGWVYAVDHFNGSPMEIHGAHAEAAQGKIKEIFLQNVGAFPNLRLLAMDSLEASQRFTDATIDMVWIDGGHDYTSVWNDLEAWWPKCRKLMCGHDATQDGVPQALRDFDAKYKTHHQIVQPINTVWYIERSLCAL